MKRFLTLVLIVLAVLYALGGRTAGAGEGWELRQVGRALGLDLSGGTLVRLEDTHGGFHGDGETFAEVELDGLGEALADAPGWKPLPMPENVDRAVHLTGLEGLAEFDGIGEGFYFFCDRHSESEDPYDDAGLHDRGSWNFTVAAYDSARGRLYYYKLDT